MEKKTTIEPQGQTVIGTIDVSNHLMIATFRFTIEGQESYYSHQTKSHIDYITDAHQKLEAWELGEIRFVNNPPDYHEMIDKEIEKLKHLTEYTPRYDFSRIVNNGAFYTDMAGVFLFVLNPYPEQQKTATIILERIRWLTERMKSTKEEHIAPPPVPADDSSDSKELAFLCHMIKELKLTPPLKMDIDYGDKLKFTTNQVLFALYQYCEDENLSCAKSVQCFAEKLHPFIAPNKTVNSVQQRIGRANEETCKTYIGESRLKNLTVKDLKSNIGCEETTATLRFNKWNGLYDLIKKAAQRYNMTNTNKG